MIVFTDEEWQAHQQQIAELTTQVADLRAQLAAAQQRIAELETQKLASAVLRESQPAREAITGAPEARARAESRPSP